MRRFVGIAVIIVGLLHLVYVVAAKSGPLTAIIRGGVLNAVEPHPDREAAFWSFWFGLFVITTGVLMARLQAAGRPVPTLVGWTLLGMGLLGGATMPLSGFWAGIPLGLLVLMPERRRTHPVTFHP